MSIPADPTPTTIVTEAIKRGGRTTPNATQITAALEHQFREVKADITQRSSRHQSLETQYVTSTVVGQSRYTWPTDADELRSIQIVYGDTATFWSGAAQAGAASSITVNASFNQASDDVTGKFIYILSGSAANQFRQIITYNNSTKLVTVDRAWVVNPSAATQYLIATAHHKLYSFDKPWGYDTLVAPYGKGLPRRAAPVGREVWLDRPADVMYGLWFDYWANLDLVDDAGTVFIRHLREHRSLWVQGVAVKTMQRYDEDRYQLELQVYNNMLEAYGSYSAGVSQVNFTDV